MAFVAHIAEPYLAVASLVDLDAFLRLRQLCCCLVDDDAIDTSAVIYCVEV